MKIPLRHKWALKVARASLPVTPAMAILPQLCFVAAGICGIDGLFSIKAAQWQLPVWMALFCAVMGILTMERRAFTELLAEKDAEIQKLQAEHKKPA